MKYIETPLGSMHCDEDQGNRVLETRTVIDGESVYISVMVESFESVDAAQLEFASRVIENFSEYRRAAIDYLSAEYQRDPEQFGGKVSANIPIVRWPQITFFEGKQWGILFGEGVFKICDPYGILVNFDDQAITGFEDLSDAEEI